MTRSTQTLMRLAVLLAVLAGNHVERARAAEPPGRFVVTNSGTANGLVYDTVTHLSWQQTINTGDASGASFSCGMLSIGSQTSGWRLPQVKELISIMDFEATTTPYIDQIAFPGVGQSLSDANTAFWTITGQPANPTSNILAIDFVEGMVETFQNTSTLSYRCVNGP